VLSATVVCLSPDSRNTKRQPYCHPTFDGAAYLYYAERDTLAALAVRFDVKPSELRSGSSIPATDLISPGTLLIIPERFSGNTTPNVQIIPDSELVFSASATNFDIADYITEANGHLSRSREYLGSTGWTTGPEAIRRLAYENSINPRLLLGLLDYEGRWVHGEPIDALHIDYPSLPERLLQGMFSQMVWAVNRSPLAIMAGEPARLRS
jgi:hypothetical protein